MSKILSWAAMVIASYLLPLRLLCNSSAACREGAKVRDFYVLNLDMISLVLVCFIVICSTAREKERERERERESEREGEGEMSER